jgi:peptidoglycan hydrolase FlgJ
MGLSISSLKPHTNPGSEFGALRAVDLSAPSLTLPQGRGNTVAPGSTQSPLPPPPLSSPLGEGRGRVREGADKSSVAKAKAQATEFESVFISTMLGHMFTGLEGEGPMGAGNGAGSETWRSMLSDEYGKMIAQSGGVGLADKVMREILTLQEGA